MLYILATVGFLLLYRYDYLPYFQGRDARGPDGLEEPLFGSLLYRAVFSYVDWNRKPLSCPVCLAFWIGTPLAALGDPSIWASPLYGLASVAVLKVVLGQLDYWSAVGRI